LSQWVRDYGIDGFRVDTAKHVEQAAWQQLKTRPPRRWRNGKSQSG
jgi:alpha-amylase